MVETLTEQEQIRLKKVLSKIRRLEITAKKTSYGRASGAYASTFRGEGIEFDSVREYDESDDSKRIDANVSARFSKPFVKQFTEEREQILYFLVDVSASSGFGGGRNKRDTAAEFCAILGHNALANNDRIALLLFSDHVEKYIPPGKGHNHLLLILREILFYEPTSTGTSVGKSLRYFFSRRTKHGLIFIISDFMDSGFKDELRQVSISHPVYLSWLMDVYPEATKPLGLIRFTDSETGEEAVVDASDNNWLEELKKGVLEKELELNSLRSRRVSLLKFPSDKPVDKILRLFFHRGRR